MFASRMCCPRRFPQLLERTLGDGPASAQEAPWPPEPPPGLPELLATAEGLAKGPLAAHGLLNMQSVDATTKHPDVADEMRGQPSPAVDRQHRHRYADRRGLKRVRTGQETGRAPSVSDGAIRTVDCSEAVRTLREQGPAGGAVPAMPRSVASVKSDSMQLT